MQSPGRDGDHLQRLLQDNEHWQVKRLKEVDLAKMRYKFCEQVLNVTLAFQEEVWSKLNSGAFDDEQMAILRADEWVANESQQRSQSDMNMARLNLETAEFYLGVAQAELDKCREARLNAGNSGSGFQEPRPFDHGFGQANHNPGSGQNPSTGQVPRRKPVPGGRPEPAQGPQTARGPEPARSAEPVPGPEAWRRANTNYPGSRSEQERQQGPMRVPQSEQDPKPKRRWWQKYRQTPLSGFGRDRPQQPLADQEWYRLHQLYEVRPPTDSRYFPNSAQYSEPQENTKPEPPPGPPPGPPRPSKVPLDQQRESIGPESRPRSGQSNPRQGADQRRQWGDHPGSTQASGHREEPDPEPQWTRKPRPKSPPLADPRRGAIPTPPEMKRYFDDVGHQFSDMPNLQIFPEPPAWACGNNGCMRSRVAGEMGACACNIKVLFAYKCTVLDGGDFVKNLRKERARWHTDKFSSFNEALKSDFQAKAGYIFSVVNGMFEAEKEEQRKRLEQRQSQSQGQSQPQGQTESRVQSQPQGQSQRPRPGTYAAYQADITTESAAAAAAAGVRRQQAEHQGYNQQAGYDQPQGFGPQHPLYRPWGAHVHFAEDS